MTIYLLDGAFGPHFTNNPAVFITVLIGVAAWDGIKHLFRKKKQ